MYSFLVILLTPRDAYTAYPTVILEVSAGRGYKILTVLHAAEAARSRSYLRENCTYPLSE